MISPDNILVSTTACFNTPDGAYEAAKAQLQLAQIAGYSTYCHRGKYMGMYEPGPYSWLQPWALEYVLRDGIEYYILLGPDFFLMKHPWSLCEFCLQADFDVLCWVSGQRQSVIGRCPNHCLILHKTAFHKFILGLKAESTVMKTVGPSVYKSARPSPHPVEDVISEALQDSAPADRILDLHDLKGFDEFFAEIDVSMGYPQDIVSRPRKDWEDHYKEAALLHAIGAKAGGIASHKLLIHMVDTTSDEERMQRNEDDRRRQRGIKVPKRRVA